MRKIRLLSLLRPLAGTAFAVSSALIVLANPAIAQDWRFEPTIRIGGELDDNATLNVRTDEEVELRGYLLDVLADIRYRSPKSRFFMQPRVLLRNYPDEPDFDSDDIFLRSNYQYRGVTNTVGFRVNFDRQSVRTAERTDADFDLDDPVDIPENDSGRTLRFGTRDKWRIVPFWDYRFTNTSSFRTEFDYIDARYDDVIDDLLADYTDARVNLSYRQGFSPVTTGVITVTGRRYESGSGDMTNEIDGLGALMGFEHDVSEKAVFSMMVGLEDTGQEGIEEDPEVVGHITLTRNLETIRLLAQYRRSISASGASRVEVRDTVNFNFSRRLSEKIAAGLGFRAYQTRGRGTAEIDSDRNYVQLQATFGWYLTKSLSINAEYRYTVLDRRAESAESANSNRINLWFVYQPRTVPTT